jgi:hypothetical protein
MTVHSPFDPLRANGDYEKTVRGEPFDRQAHDMVVQA